MYRTILVSTFLGLLALALACAGLAWLGATDARYHLERTRLSHEVLQAHLQLDVKAYKLFKQLTDTLLANGARKFDEATARRRLADQFEAVRHAIAREVSFVGDREDESEELTRLAAIERQIGQVLEQFRAAEELIAKGESLRDAPLLDDVLERSIDRVFRGLLDAAIAEEQEEVTTARRLAATRLDRIALLSQIAGAAAVLLSAGALAILLRRLRRPLQELVTAASAIAGGDLSYRVPIGGRDEFGRVSESFNLMTGQLSHSRAQVEAARQQLEAAIRERTAELAQANSTLRRADEIRRRFLADISHELRTPLTVIRGEAEVTLRGREVPPEDYRTALSRIVEQAIHTGRLVDDLLFVARTQAGEPRMNLQSVALNQVARRACGDAEVLAEAKQIRISLQDDARDGVVQGDPDKLRQLIMILLDNAVRYSEHGGTVEVFLSPGPRGVALRIVDHGIGIAEDEVPRVFERFYRGENASERHKEGSGLGLAMAKAIVEAHAGEITLQSRLGEGTTVSVALPTVRKMRVVA